MCLLHSRYASSDHCDALTSSSDTDVCHPDRAPDFDGLAGTVSLTDAGFALRRRAIPLQRCL